MIMRSNQTIGRCHHSLLRSILEIEIARCQSLSLLLIIASLFMQLEMMGVVFVLCLGFFLQTISDAASTTELASITENQNL